MYFDKAGNPVALSKWQYGIKNSGKITLLLNKNGNAMLCVDNILNGFPFIHFSAENLVRHSRAGMNAA